MVEALTSALPSAMMLTSPCADTVAIVSSVDNQVTVLSAALAGATVATSVSFPPTSRDNVVLFNVTPVGATLLGFLIHK